ncbi:MAG: YceI family protein [Pseudomonadota bacterium]
MKRLSWRLFGVAVLLGCAGVARADVADFAIDPAHTHIAFGIDRFGFARTLGGLTLSEGTIRFDPNDISSTEVTATLPVSSLHTALAERDHILLGPHWLSASEWPVIRFESTKVRRAASDGCPQQCYVVAGLLTVKGAAAPIQLDVVLNRVGTDPVSGREALGASASVSLSRAAFGIDIAAGKIGDAIDVQLEVLAIATD